MLAKGKEITNAPNIVDFLAISLAATITVPEKSPLPIQLIKSIITNRINTI